MVGEINATCGACPTCLAGRASHCERRTVLGIVHRDGAFADFLTLPIANLHAVPDTVPDEVAVFAEPVAAAFQILAQVAIDPRDRVVVFGDGKLGQVIAQALATTGCALTVVGRHPRKLAHLAARGIATRLDPPPPRAADVVVDCTGRREGLPAALAALRPRGTLVLKSTFAGDSAIEPVGDRRRRDHDRRIALRPVRAGARRAGLRCGDGDVADRGSPAAGRRRGRARPGRVAGRAQGPARPLTP